MSVLTEAKIRQYAKELGILEHGVFELARGERLTPAARSFLTDHRVKIIDSNLTREKSSVTQQTVTQQPVKSLEDSAVYPLLFRLTKLYPYFLRAQRELHQVFLSDKCEQLGVLLGVLEQVAGQHLLDDMPAYHDSLATHTELEVIREREQLEQGTVMMGYQEPSWRLACYETYLELAILRQDLALVSDFDRDSFAVKVCQLLKSLEVLVWLVTSE